MSVTDRDPSYIMLDGAGLNGGVPPAVGARDYLTPRSCLFTRSHAAIPDVDVAAWRLAVDGLIDRPLTLSLADLRGMPMHEVTATLICAGMRRREFLRLGPLPGELPWGAEPVGTVRWGGISLADVLAAAGVRAACRHVEFTGLDQVERHGELFGFGGSIPIEKAQHRDVLLALTLNDEPLTREHGAPVRVLVPGWIGARSVKWLGRIDLTDAPSENYFRAQAYRVQRTVDPADSRSVAHGEPLEEVTLNSLITSPCDGARLRPGPTVVSGWAIGPHAEPPSRVEVSVDGGQTWAVADLHDSPDRWTWRLWRATLMLEPGMHELVVRAWDHAGKAQPRSIEETWNVKGYLNNAWHRVTISVTA